MRQAEIKSFIQKKWGINCTDNQAKNLLLLMKKLGLETSRSDVREFIDDHSEVVPAIIEIFGSRNAIGDKTRKHADHSHRRRYIKPTARGRYEQIVQFVWNGICEELQNLRMPEKLLRLFMTHGIAVCIDRTSFRIYAGNIPRPVIRHSINWSALRRAWLDRYPADKRRLNKPDSMRVLFTRAYSRVGCPNGNLPNPLFNSVGLYLRFCEAMAHAADDLNPDNPENALYLKRVGPWFEKMRRIESAIKTSSNYPSSILAYNESTDAWEPPVNQSKTADSVSWSCA